MKIIAMINLKGGVGKTTTAVNMAAILATEHNKRVLLVDADSSGNATSTLLREGVYNTISRLLLGTLPSGEQCVYPSALRNLDVLPSDFSLEVVGLPNVHGGQYNRLALRDCLEDFAACDAYDYVIVDCPSSFSHPGCMCAILAATEVIVPIKPDAYAADAATELFVQVSAMRALNPDLRIAGCLFTMYYKQMSVNLAAQQFRVVAVVPVYEAVIRRSPKADDCMAVRKTLAEFSPRSSAAQDYRQFVAEYLKGEVQGNG